MRMRASLGMWAVVGLAWTGLSTTQALEPVNVALTSLEDSGSYFVYRYVVRNPGGSAGGIAEVRLAVDAPEGTSGSVLPATGPFRNGPSLTSSIPVTPHVEVGPVSPTDWQASLGRDAELAWYGVNGLDIDFDSIAPGDSLTGVGVRSSYLPGIRDVRATPTLQACCSEPWGTEETNPDRAHPLPEDSAVLSLTVGPTYDRSTMQLDTLAALLDRVCTAPLWIDDSTLCTEMEDSLDAAAARLAIDDYEGAAVAITGVGDLADANRTIRGGDVEENAYWMLKINSDHVADTIAARQSPVAYGGRCAEGS